MKTIPSLAAFALLTAATSFAVVGCKTAGSNSVAASPASESGGAPKPYPLAKCVVTDEALGDKPYVFVRDGQEIKLCCKDCLADFNKDSQKYMAKLHATK